MIIVPTYAAILGLLFIYLSRRVVKTRRRERIAVGDGGNIGRGGGAEPLSVDLDQRLKPLHAPARYALDGVAGLLERSGHGIGPAGNRKRVVGNAHRRALRRRQQSHHFLNQLSDLDLFDQRLAVAATMDQANAMRLLERNHPNALATDLMACRLCRRRRLQLLQKR